jgi:hypothetical protein
VNQQNINVINYELTTTPHPFVFENEFFLGENANCCDLIDKKNGRITDKKNGMTTEKKSGKNTEQRYSKD